MFRLQCAAPWIVSTLLLVAPGIPRTAATASPEMALTSPTTRETLAYLIAHSVGDFSSFVPPTEPTYTDVPVDSCRYAEIEYVASLGLLPGSPDGIFDPQWMVTRANMAY